MGRCASVLPLLRRRPGKFPNNGDSSRDRPGYVPSVSASGWRSRAGRRRRRGAARQASYDGARCAGRARAGTSMRRALKTCGTRQTSASVGASPRQKGPRPGARRACARAASKPSRDPVRGTSSSRAASSASQLARRYCSTRRLLSGWMSQAIGERDGAHPGAVGRRRRAAAAARVRLVQVLDDRERLREARAPSTSSIGHEPLRVLSRGSRARAARPCAGARSAARRSRPFRFSAMRTRNAAEERK